MASPLDPPTPRSLGGLAVDPWDWTVEDVVTALCDPTGMLKSVRPEPTSFAKCLRENQIDGAVLLTGVNSVTLRNEFGIGALGSRIAVENAILKLQAGSQQWREHKKIETVVSRISNQDHVSGYATPYQTAPLQYTTPMMPALNRYLMEPLDTPERIQRSIPGYHVLENPNTPSQHQALNGQIGGLLDTTQPSQLDPNLQQGRRRSRGVLHSSHHEALFQQEEGYHSSGLTPPESRKNRATSSDGRNAEDPVETVASLRRGEAYVVDDSGRKRRRLQLDAPTSPRARSRSPTEFNLVATVETPKETNEQQLSNAESTFSNEKMPVSNLMAKHTHVVEDARFAMMEPPAELAVKVPEPGELVLNPEGRKRMRPTLVSQKGDSEQGLETLSRQVDYTDSGKPPAAPALAPAKEQLRTISGRSKDTRKPHQVYLGSNPLPVDEVFYGETPMDQEVRYGSEEETISSSDLPSHSEEFVFRSDGVYGTGQQIYVNNRIQHFLLAREVTTDCKETSTLVIYLTQEVGLWYDRTTSQQI
ncbi:MAG: hypothetical protein Q9187_007846 [Circinaria calcarea]